MCACECVFSPLTFPYTTAHACNFRITPLDPWKTSMLLKAKKFISDQAGEGDVDLVEDRALPLVGREGGAHGLAGERPVSGGAEDVCPAFQRSIPVEDAQLELDPKDAAHGVVDPVGRHVGRGDDDDEISRRERGLHCGGGAPRQVADDRRAATGTGVDHGVLYSPDPVTGAYDSGVVWNGLTAVTESPSGAESNKRASDQWA